MRKAFTWMAAITLIAGEPEVAGVFLAFSALCD